MNSTSPALRWTNKALLLLMWPLIIEQLLSVTMGIADTVMVSALGEYAISGVAIVDSIGVLVINILASLTAGGTVVVSQYIGRQDTRSASLASKQLIYISALVSSAFMLAGFFFHGPLLSAIYGDIEASVMRAAKTYFWITALSFPGIALYNAGAALFRSIGNSRVTMKVALVVNLLNIGGNWFFIFVLKIGVAGAALSTLISRIAGALIILFLLVKKHSGIVSLSGILKISLIPPMIKSILGIGIPSGLENSMFQLGRLLVSRFVTAFGTVAIAANAITTMINSISFMPGMAFGMALLTVVGQCVGAGDYENARRYTRKLLTATHIVVLIVCISILFLRENIVSLFQLSQEAHDLAKLFIMIYTLISPVTWPLSFALPNALRAAGDARYCLVTGSVSMWLFRVGGAYVFSFTFGFGPIGIWIAMCIDFTVRSALFLHRWRSGKWETKKVIRE